MSNMMDWQDRNAHYLALSVESLRLRLERYIQGVSTPVPTKDLVVQTMAAVSVNNFPSSDWDQYISGLPDEGTTAESLPKDSREAGDQRLAWIQFEREAAIQAEPAPALESLSKFLGLSSFEQDILLLCAALEFDTRVAGLCAQAQSNPNRPYPTFALALALFDDPAWDALSPERPLRYWRLIEINQPAGLPLTQSPLRADERIVNYIKGLNHLDDRLSAWITPVEDTGASALLAPSQQTVVHTIIEYLVHAQSTLPVIVLLGADRASKQSVAQAVTEYFGRQLFRIDTDCLPAQLPEVETLARLWQRENQLLPLALYLNAQSTESALLDSNAAFKRFLSHPLGLAFLDLREAPARLNFPARLVDVNKPNPTEQREAWNAILKLSKMHKYKKAADQLAGQFSLNLADIHQVIQVAADGKGPQMDGLWDTCRTFTRPQLDRLAQRLEPRAKWEDLVLLDETLNLLRQIAGQVEQRHRVYETWGFAEKMERGLGLSALFTGESGTGKTMAAEVIANDLRLNLYRIDLSAVVSKYIGETEKNLRQLFDAAEDGGAILFFDEADALFGKRSEVKDSHDRYANIEINYLLQRMEAYRGLAILATNMKSALDTAFMRRLRFVVNFAFPGQAERKAIWQKVFPKGVPKSELDLERLARLNLTGGAIHNIAINAAFLAAQAKRPVTTPLVLNAARTELRKLERPISEADFR